MRYHAGVLRLSPPRGLALALTFVGVVASSGCDNVFTLTPVRLPIDAPPDSPPDAPPDAPPILMCDVSPIILRPTSVVQETWAEQVPAGPSHAEIVADGDVPDDGASYLATSGDGQLDMYGHIPIHSGVVVAAVTVWVRARIDVTTPASSVEVAPALRIDAAYAHDDRTITETWSNRSGDRYATSLATGSAWTVDEVNRMVFGVRKSYFMRTLVTQVWASVECTQP